MTTGCIKSKEDLKESEAATLKTRLRKGLRARTLRLRLQSAEKARNWIMVARRGEWFKTAEDFEAYLVDISSRKGVGVSTYERARYGLMYLEAAAGRAPEEMLSMSPATKGTIKELVLQTSTVSQKTKVQAPQLLASIIYKLESLVMDDKAHRYHRAYAWVKLVAFWGAMRGDDATWIVPTSIQRRDGVGTIGKLSRTKSTGPGREY